MPIGQMWAIPQGGNVLRQHTPSGLFIDEKAFQPSLEAGIGATSGSWSRAERNEKVENYKTN